MSPRSPVIVALDVARAADALALADSLAPAECRLKVGKELFTAEGPAVVRALHDRGFEVFLDLKFLTIVMRYPPGELFRISMCKRKVPYAFIGF